MIRIEFWVKEGTRAAAQSAMDVAEALRVAAPEGAAIEQGPPRKTGDGTWMSWLQIALPGAGASEQSAAARALSESLGGVWEQGPDNERYLSPHAAAPKIKALQRARILLIPDTPSWVSSLLNLFR